MADNTYGTPYTILASAMFARNLPVPLDEIVVSLQAVAHEADCAHDRGLMDDLRAVLDPLSKLRYNLSKCEIKEDEAGDLSRDADALRWMKDIDAAARKGVWSATCTLRKMPFEIERLLTELGYTVRSFYSADGTHCLRVSWNEARPVLSRLRRYPSFIDAATARRRTLHAIDIRERREVMDSDDFMRLLSK